jgi:uncharacterized protein YutE (UPF0331/DUF86 family)/predicted nucleotidyltransferase
VEKALNVSHPNLEKIKLLKEYFEKNPEILMAFLFGSQAKNLARGSSDWDVGVYFKPKEYLELEQEGDYPNENKVWSDLVDTLKADVDFLVLNRARPSLVFSVLNSGFPLVVKDRKLYLRLLCKTSYEAIDFWDFVYDFWKIREKAKSLSQEDRAVLIEHLVFLEEEFKDLEEFKKLTWGEYQKDRFRRRNIERWVENLVMTSLDIAKITLAADKKEIPQTYKDVLKIFGLYYFSPSFATRFSQFAELRNIVVHEYLDIKWNKISRFIKEAENLYPEFIERTKKIIK